MVDPTHDFTNRDDTELGPNGESVEGTPRWAKVFGLITLVLIALLATLLLLGGHGPGRHTLSAGPGQLPASAS